MSLSSSAIGMSMPRVAVLAGAKSPAGTSTPLSAAVSAGLGDRSAFDVYRQFAEKSVTSWRAADDRVGHIGGWPSDTRDGQRGPDAGTAAVAVMSSGSMADMPGMCSGRAATPAEAMSGHSMS